MDKDPVNDHDQIIIDMVNQHQGMLLRMCYVYLRDQELAKDAVQETFLKAYCGLNSFRGESSPKTWLIQIAMNTCKSMQRSAWLRHHDRRITPEDVTQVAVMEETAEIVDEMMMLPSKLKEVIMLYYWQDLNVSEIAQLLGVAQSTVSRRLTQAREKLHEMMDRREQRGRS